MTKKDEWISEVPLRLFMVVYRNKNSLNNKRMMRVYKTEARATAYVNLLRKLDTREYINTIVYKPL